MYGRCRVPPTENLQNKNKRQGLPLTHKQLTTQLHRNVKLLGFCMLWQHRCVMLLNTIHLFVWLYCVALGENENLPPVMKERCRQSFRQMGVISVNKWEHKRADWQSLPACALWDARSALKGKSNGLLYGTNQEEDGVLPQQIELKRISWQQMVGGKNWEIWF